MASWPSNLFLTIKYPHSQLVTILMCDWWVAEMSMKDGWRSAREEVGGQCVMMIGMTLMQWWCADSLEYLQTVSHVPVMSLLFSHDVYLHVYIRKRFVYYYLACRFTSSRTGQQIWPWNWTHLLGWCELQREWGKPWCLSSESEDDCSIAYRACWDS